MTLRTITFDDSIYKLVPLEPSEEWRLKLARGKCEWDTAYDVISDVIAAAPEYQEPDNQIAKNAERYEKVRKLDARQLAEIFRMNIQEGIPFDELIDGLYIFTAQDIAEAEKEGEKMWHALCEDDGGQCGAGGYCKDCIQDTKKDE